MNLIKLDLKLIAIIVLISVVVIQQCGGDQKKEKGEKIKIDGKKYEVIKHEIDTVEVVKTKTIIKKGKDIYHDTTIYVKLPSDPIDTISILKDYYSKKVYKDVIYLSDSLGVVKVTDTISQNTIVSRKYDTEVSQRYIKDMMIVKESQRNQVYYGPTMSFDGQNIINSVGGNLLLKTKNDKIYQVGMGLMNQSKELTPYINGGINWKIRIKK
jgi:hypothetical protein